MITISPGKQKENRGAFACGLFHCLNLLCVPVTDLDDIYRGQSQLSGIVQSYQLACLADLVVGNLLTGFYALAGLDLAPSGSRLQMPF